MDNSAEELGRHLEKQIPFLRQMLVGLKQDCGQYVKINAICDIIEKRRKANISHATLQKCDRVIQLLKDVGARKGRLAKQERPPKQDVEAAKPMVASVATHCEPIDSPDDGIQSPDDEFQIMSPDDEIKSPDGADASTERYDSERPSIYSVVAESIKRASPPPPPPPPRAPVVPVVDTSKPPISAADLQVLLLDDALAADVTKAAVDDAAEKAVGVVVQRSKVSLVPTPFHKKVRKSGDRDATGSKHKGGRSDRDSKGVAASQDKGPPGSKAKACKTVVESGSVFGSILSGLDEKLIVDKARRDSRDGDAARCDSAGGGAASRSAHSKDRSRDKDRERVGVRDKRGGKHGAEVLEKKIEAVEKEAAAALKKEGLSASEKAELKKKSADRIKRYRRELEALKRHDRDAGKYTGKDKEKGKSKSTEKERGKTSEKSKERDKDKPRDKTNAKRKDKEATKVKVPDKAKDKDKIHGTSNVSEKAKETNDKTESVEVLAKQKTEATKDITESAVEEQARLSEGIKKILGPGVKIKKKVEDKSAAVGTTSPEVVKPPPQPQNSNPASKDGNALRSPQREVGTDHLHDQVAAAKKGTLETTKPPLPEGVKKILGPGVIIRKKLEDKSAPASAEEKIVKPMEPPPLPLGFQDFNPFANESAEVNRLYGAKKRENPPFASPTARDANPLRSPLHDVGVEHLLHEAVVPNRDPREFRDVREPRVPADPRTYRDPRDPRDPREYRDPREMCDRRDAREFRRMEPGFHPPPSPREFPPDAYGPRHHPMQHRLARPQSNLLHGRWEPPPGAERRDDAQWPMGNRFPPPPPQPPPLMNQPAMNNPGFHPFEPIGNEYDLSKMQPVDFYSPVKQQNSTPQNYRQWRELRQRDEHRKRLIEEAKEAEKKKEEARKLKEKEDEQAKKKQEDEEAKKMEEEKGEEAKADEAGQKVDAKIDADNVSDEQKKTDADAKPTDRAKNDDGQEECPDDVVKKGKKRGRSRRPVVLDSSDSEDDKPLKRKAVDVPAPATVKTDVADEPKEEKDVPECTKEPENEVDRAGLLKILSQAKKATAADGGTYVPTKILEMMESFLQKEAAASKSAIQSATVPNEAIKEDVDEKLAVAVPAEGEVKIEHPVDGSSQAATDASKDVAKVVPSVDKVAGVVGEVKEATDVGVEEAKGIEEGDMVKAEQAKPDAEWQIGRRLRRRTKSINYNEVRISDSEDSPKRKKRLIEAMENASPSPTSVKARPSPKDDKEVSSAPSPTPAKSKSVKGKAASKRIDEDETLQVLATRITDGADVKDDSISAETADGLAEDLTEAEEECRAAVKNPDALAVAPPKTRGRKKKPNIERIIDGVADGSISLDYKFEEVAGHERAAEARTLDLIVQGEYDEMFSREDEEFNGFLAVGRSVDAPVAEKEADPKERKEKSKRKTELDQLHLDIKSSLGDGIMGPGRRGLNTGSSSRASSPGSVKSSASLRDDLRDVKITPAVDEILKQGKTLRVVLEKLPENREVCASPASTATGAHRIGPKSRMNRGASKTPQSDGGEPTKMAAELNCDKEYYLKFERNYVNACRLCKFAGAHIVAHYIDEHPAAAVPISRLAPDATLDACQEAILNDYAGVEEAAPAECKKPLKYDFRCRFCFHDLQKEFVATFYDHVSSHTGELRYRCTECHYKHHVRANVKNHIQFAHNLTKEPHADDVSKHCDKLFGYVCSECNYLQLTKATVAAHVRAYHGKDAFLYTINMSLPILQRTMKANRELGFEGGADVPGVRRLRSRQKKAEERKDETPPEKVDRSEKAKADGSKAIMDQLMVTTNAPEDFALPSELLPAGARPPPSSAFVCDDWDDLLKADVADDSVVDEVVAAPKRSSGFLDALKRRLDEQQEEETTTTPTTTTRTAYLSPPNDKEVLYSSEIGADSDDDDDAQAVRVKKEHDADKPTKVGATRKQRPPNAPLRKLHSVGVIDAMIDGSGGITYICRKNACIFQTTDPRVHEVHCNYTHSNSIEQMDCSFCPARDVALPMVEVFAHLFDHVESYQASVLELPLASIKQEKTEEEEQEEEEEEAANEDVIEIADDGAPQREPPPPLPPPPPPTPRLPFMISKVESLANKEPPPLATLSPAKLAAADKEDKKAPPSPSKPKSRPFVEKGAKGARQPQPNTAICKIVAMHRMELQMDRKSEAVMAAWLKEGLSALFKCPRFNCPFFTHAEDAFEAHLKEHAFGEAFLPCLYCNFKMRPEFVKIHIMMRHARCNFGCGHCLYRARKSEYVVVHHGVCHEDKTLRVKEFDLSNFVNRYRPPFLPPIKNVLKPYECGCGKKYYLMKVCQNHHLTCPLAGQDNYDQMFAFNCRYCADGGAHTYFEVFRHIALEHPFHDVAIVCRQKNEVVQKRVSTNILSQLVIRDDTPVAIKANAGSGGGPTTINAIIPVSLTSSVSSAPLIPVCAVPAVPKSQIMTIAGGVTSGPRLFLVLDDIKKTTEMVAPPTSAVANVVQTSAAPISSVVVASKPPPPPPPPPPSPPSTTDANSEAPPSELYKCHHCRRVSETPAQFAQHLEACVVDGAGKPYVCVYCGRNYRYAYTLVGHMRAHGAKNLSCGLCGHKEARLNCLKRHVKDVHKLNNIVLQPVNPDKSNIDVDNFIGKPVLTAPMDSGVLAPDADDDGTAFGPADVASVPITPIFKFMATCKNCDFSTKVRSNFLRHLQLHTSGKFDSTLHVGEAVNPVPCLEKNELMFDKMTNLAASSFEGRMAPKAAPAAAAAAVAPKADEPAAKDAVPTYVPEVRRYVCGATGCNYLCLEEQNLRHHLQALHDNEQVFRCVHCKVEIAARDGKAAYIDIDAIMEHFRLHDGALYKCAHCDYLSSKAGKVERHSGEKHADKPVRPLVLRQDVDGGIGGEEPHDAAGRAAKRRPWKCCICTCRKAAEDEIKLHVKEKHTLDAQYKCTHCPFKDDVSTGFPWHFQTCHPKLSPDIIVAYFRDDKEEQGEQLGGRFDTTPLWVKNRDAVKHIRGILLDEEAGTARKGARHAPKTSPAKLAAPRPVGVKRRKSAKPVDNHVQKVQKISKGNEEEIVFVVDADARTKASDGVIEISDDDITLAEIEKLSVDEILAPAFVATHGPTLGVPAGSAYVCPYCGANFAADADFRDHLYQELKYNRFACPICKQETTTLARMSEHYTRAHVVLCAEDAIATLPKNANCELWIKKVLRLQDRVIEHRRKTTQVAPVKPNVKLLYKCSHCGHNTHNKLDAVAHCRAAHGNLPVKFINPLNTSPS